MITNWKQTCLIGMVSVGNDTLAVTLSEDIQASGYRTIMVQDPETHHEDPHLVVFIWDGFTPLAPVIKKWLLVYEDFSFIIIADSPENLPILELSKNGLLGVLPPTHLPVTLDRFIENFLISRFLQAEIESIKKDNLSKTEIIREQSDEIQKLNEINLKLTNQIHELTQALEISEKKNILVDELSKRLSSIIPSLKTQRTPLKRSLSPVVDSCWILLSFNRQQRLWHLEKLELGSTASLNITSLMDEFLDRLNQNFPVPTMIRFISKKYQLRPFTICAGNEITNAHLGIQLTPKNLSKWDRISDRLAFGIWFNHHINLLNLNRLKELTKKFDPLTGLENLIGFEKRTLLEISRCKRTQSPLSFILWSFDKAQELQESLGEATYEDLLVKIINTIRSNIRNYDYLFRIAPNEFGLLLPQANLAQAAGIAERLRRFIKNQNFGIHRIITISAGVIQWHEGIETEKDLINQARQALQVATQNNGDRICVFQSPSQESRSTSC